MSRTKASFSKLEQLEFEGSPSISMLEHLEFEGSLARNAFLRDSRCTKCCILHDKTVSDDVWGSLPGGRFRNTPGSTGIMVGSAAQTASSGVTFLSSTFKNSRKSRTKASISKLERLEFEGSLERKLRFQSLITWKLKEIYCVLQLSLCRWPCNSCVKVAWRRGCVRNTIVFSSWTS